jgi:hypothetical protein
MIRDIYSQVRLGPLWSQGYEGDLPGVQGEYGAHVPHEAVSGMPGHEENLPGGVHKNEIPRGTSREATVRVEAPLYLLNVTILERPERT